MTSHRPSRLLAITPGTKYLGYAVFEGKDLVQFRAKAFFGKKSAETFLPRIEGFLDRLLDQCGATAMAMEEIYYTQRSLSPLLQKTIDHLKRRARARGIRVASHPPTIIKEHFCEGRPTRNNLAEAMIRRYPYLHRFRRRKSDQAYWLQMFDAVALGTFATSKA